MDCLTPERRLQAVGDVAGNFLLDPDRHLADLGVEGFGRLQDARGRALVRQQLDQGDQVRRVEGMAEQKARGIAPAFLHLAHHQAGGRGGDDGLGRQMRLDLGEEGVLDIQPLRHVLLNELRALDGRARRVVEHDAVGVALQGQAELFQRRPGPRHVIAHLGFGALGWIVHRDCETSREEQRGPARADDAGADDGGPFEVLHHSNPGLIAEAAVMPPSTVKHWPLAKPASSEASQTAMPAISSGAPKRPTG